MNEATNMNPEWIARVMRENPSQLLDNGNIRTCPVRLSFANIFKPGKPVPPNTEGKHGAVLLYPLGAPMDVYIAECLRVTKEKMPAALQPGGPRIHNPIKRIKAADDPSVVRGDHTSRYEGYVVGAPVIGVTASQKPPCVDQKLAPITDESKVYSGVWAFCTIRAFWFDKGVNKGPSFGLQSVMIIADDRNISGAAANPNVDFAGVSIDASVNPADAFGTGGTAGQTAQEPAVSLFG